jgi:nucleoside-diphosphate-sugar epimerase
VFSIFGASGFIGSHFSDYVKAKGHKVNVMPRDINEIPMQTNLGHVVYCIGLTADFRSKTFETVDAHVSLLSKVLKSFQFESFLYLSSTRVYQGQVDAREGSQLSVNPNNRDDLYNLSKIMGESLCINSLSKNIKIARISNVYGKGMGKSNFLYDITQNVMVDNSLVLKTSLYSEKDYLPISDAVEMLYMISTRGSQSVYNVASGVNTSVKTILGLLEKRSAFQLDLSEDAVLNVFPKINVEKISNEFSFSTYSFDQEFNNFIEENWI